MPNQGPLGIFPHIRLTALILDYLVAPRALVTSVNAGTRIHSKSREADEIWHPS
jgi:hypothetical protein